MVNVSLLLKLMELKKQEVDDFKNDFITLNEIVSSLEVELKNQQEVVNQFVCDYIDNQNYNSTAANMISGRAYLQSLKMQSSNVEKSKLDAEQQKDAAFESLKEAVLELKKLTKIIEKARKKDLQESSRKALLIDDTLELYRHNKKA